MWLFKHLVSGKRQKKKKCWECDYGYTFTSHVEMGRELSCGMCTEMELN